MLSSFELQVNFSSKSHKKGYTKKTFLKQIGKFTSFFSEIICKCYNYYIDLVKWYRMITNDELKEQETYITNVFLLKLFDVLQNRQLMYSGMLAHILWFSHEICNVLMKIHMKLPIVSIL